MPIVPTPKVIYPTAGIPDLWTNATYFDVTLSQMVAALISSGQYAPGPLIMDLALAATSQLMVETGRWDGVPTSLMTPAQAHQRFLTFGLAK